MSATARNASVLASPGSVTTKGRRILSFVRLAGSSRSAPTPKSVRVGKEKVVRFMRLKGRRVYVPGRSLKTCKRSRTRDRQGPPGCLANPVEGGPRKNFGPPDQQTIARRAKAAAVTVRAFWLGGWTPIQIRSRTPRMEIIARIRKGVRPSLNGPMWVQVLP